MIKFTKSAFERLYCDDQMREAFIKMLDARIEELQRRISFCYMMQTVRNRPDYYADKMKEWAEELSYNLYLWEYIHGDLCEWDLPEDFWVPEAETEEEDGGNE